MLMSHIRKAVSNEARKLADATAKMFGEERGKHRAEISALRAEVGQSCGSSCRFAPSAARARHDEGADRSG